MRGRCRMANNLCAEIQFSKARKKFIVCLHKKLCTHASAGVIAQVTDSGAVVEKPSAIFQADGSSVSTHREAGIASGSMLTRHPVAEAESVFDGISYGKGASFLKQANKVLGQDNLKNALHKYFQ